MRLCEIRASLSLGCRVQSREGAGGGITNMVVSRFWSQEAESGGWEASLLFL